jgi:hypothetical protein
MNTYQIPEANLSTLQTRFAKLTRRCKRAKIEAPVMTVGEFTEHKYKNEDGFDRISRVYTVTLESNGRPKINGFEFAAVIAPQTDEDGKFLGNILRRVPGFEGELPARFRNASNDCDHCKTARRRQETFVIANAEGFKQVGRQCLANYLGLTNPEMLAELAQILIDADDLCEMSESDHCTNGGLVAERFPVEDILQTSASAIRQYGWLSRKSAEEFHKSSTSSRVVEWMTGSSKQREAFEHKLTISDEDKALATATEEWLETLENSTDEYRQNLSLLARATSITRKNFGLLCSAINAYSREKEFEIRRNKRITEDSKSDFLGAVGERITIENATVLYTTTFETNYGVTHFFKFAVGENILVYFASNPMFEQGEVIPTMTARVKAHENRVDNYNPKGVKQTIITRCTLPKPPKPPLTPEQKIAKKAIAKLKHVHRVLPSNAQLGVGAWPNGDKFEYSDYQAWNTVGNLIWDIQREAKL